MMQAEDALASPELPDPEVLHIICMKTTSDVMRDNCGAGALARLLDCCGSWLLFQAS